MKIAHVTQDDSNGGASLAAYRLHQGMLAKGLDSTFFVKYKSRMAANVVEANLLIEPSSKDSA